ncbi:MAG: hypothetical protein HKN21_12865, partial [Candidatus Eisenbacteria bacterium]|nr:hypothetical protein [Candidatus Eisenbacteria bacterium]
SICGEMAGEPLAVPLLLGLGVTHLSMSPYLIPEIKQTVRSLSRAECRALAVDALRCREVHEVAELVEARLGSRYSGLLEMTREGWQDSRSQDS